MSPDQQSGRRLHEAMRHSSDAFGPHRADLVLRAAARGRRLRLVRRARIAALAAAVAGAAVMGVTQLSPGAAPALSPAVTPTSTPTFAPAPTATLVPVPTRPPSAAPPVGGPRSGPLAAQLAAFMPPGTTTRVSSSGAFEDGRVTLSRTGTASGSVLHDDGRGGASVVVRLADIDPRTPSCDPGPWLFCDILADGTEIKAEKAKLTSGYLLWSVHVLHPDGRKVDVDELNTDRIPEKATTASPTRAEPPLTIDQLQAIALSPHWAASP
ncbi:hypothetical protein [Kitasatospora purpeofusca]|uniref:hypothetical protein n=1 Tax=Kitasatospora purpeofusca TaxID=67352 RepID=UPI0022542BF2|nr:hypothetical protein [Kitasatospora purpeofusca]MCX4757524.1 hypothetical protein [Kitasatospora purpeofusca]WSR34753.1 hypothetical protein OG715_29595 [Kitasatospora purpeofusca]